MTSLLPEADHTRASAADNATSNDLQSVCQNCRSLAHYWSDPQTQAVKLSDQTYEMATHRCICNMAAQLSLARSWP